MACQYENQSCKSEVQNVRDFLTLQLLSSTSVSSLLFATTLEGAVAGVGMRLGNS